MAKISEMFAVALADAELLLNADKVQLLNALLATDTEIPTEQMAAADFWHPDFAWYRPYNVQNGVLQVPVSGILMNGISGTMSGWFTGYRYIQEAVGRGITDPNVRGIAMVYNTPGGDASGNFDLADFLYAAREKKTIEAFVNDHALSAGYSLASAASKISMPRTGLVGSIGVVTTHVSRETALANAGVKVTLIYAGAHKVDGNPYHDLTDEAKARIQSRVDSLYNIFVGTVARNRGIDESVVRETQAGVYGPEAALEAGLADVVQPAAAALQDFEARVVKGALYMSTETDNTQAVADPAAERATGAKAERQRLQAILSCQEANGRGKLANHLAMETDLTAEQARGILAAAPVEPAAPAATPPAGTSFDQAMVETGNPNLQSESTDTDAAADPVKQIMASYRQVTGAKPKASKER